MEHGGVEVLWHPEVPELKPGPGGVGAPGERRTVGEECPGRVSEGATVTDEMECMCQQCGISTHLPSDRIFLEDPAAEARLLSDLCLCAECGGRLLLVGRAGDEPYYRTK